MVDANQAWTPKTAERRISELAPLEPYWIEEPLAADQAADWRKLAPLCAVPLSGGENLWGLGSFEEALSARYLSFIQSDVGKWGGISGGRDVALRARENEVVFCPHWLRAAMGPSGFVEVDANLNPLREVGFSAVA